MRATLKAGVCALIGVGVFGAGFALAGTVNVTLGPAGPNPATVTVQWGDTVSFANGDGVEHAVTIPRLTVASPAIPPGGSWSQAFDGRTGNYVFRQTGARDFSGAVVVQLTGSVTMTARPAAVTFGQRVTFSGRALPGFPVKLEQQPSGQAGQWVERASVPAGADGSWSTSLVPEIGGRYRASAAADQLRSGTAAVAVRPRITFTAPRRARTGSRLTLRARIAPVGSATSADLERYDTARRRWNRVDRRRVSAQGVATFRWRVVGGTSRLRISLVRVAMRQGFDPAAGKPVSVTGS
jgi:plastocyanin